MYWFDIGDSIGFWSCRVAVWKKCINCRRASDGDLRHHTYEIHLHHLLHNNQEDENEKTLPNSGFPLGLDAIVWDLFTRFHLTTSVNNRSTIRRYQRRLCSDQPSVCTPVSLKSFRDDIPLIQVCSCRPTLGDRSQSCMDTGWDQRNLFKLQSVASIGVTYGAGVESSAKTH